MNRPPASHASVKDVLARIEKFVAACRGEDFFAPDSELVVRMLRLAKIIADRDCPPTGAGEVRKLFGLAGAPLVTRLTSLLAELETGTEQARILRLRNESVQLWSDLGTLEARRDHFFGLSKEALESLWNGGANDLPEHEREIVRAALRAKLGITPEGNA